MLKVGDVVMWRRNDQLVARETVIILWLPSGDRVVHAKYGEPLVLVDHNGEPKLVPQRVLLPKPGPCPSIAWFNTVVRCECDHLEGHIGKHRARRSALGMDAEFTWS
jgi:hypothetical protein